jgi:hypothetical protein
MSALVTAKELQNIELYEEVGRYETPGNDTT